MYPNYIFLWITYRLDGGGEVLHWGFDFLFDNTSLCCPYVCISLPLSLPFIFCCICDFNWLRLFINSVYSLCSFSTHFVFVIKLKLVFLFWGSKRSQCILHYLNFQLVSKRVHSLWFKNLSAILDPVLRWTGFNL